MRRRWVGFLLLLLISVLLSPRLARADQPGAHTVNVAVLAFDSEDAETQADALTGALRNRVRNAPGWSVVDTTQSLGMLTAALRCPSRPPPDCQQKISEQIKVDRYIWGYVAKGPTQGQVTAEIHFYQKGKPDTVLKESYAENLTDPNDDKGLGKVAGHILDRLGGSAMGTVVVRAGDATGEVIVDGEKRVPLQAGQARIELGAGGHSIEISSPGASPTKRNVLVTAGKETVVDMEIASANKPENEPSSFPTRKVIAGSLVGAGVVLGVVSVLSVVAYSKNQDDGKKLAEDPNVAPNETQDDACKAYDSGQYAHQEDKLCKAHRDSIRNSTVAIITGAAGGVAILAGVYLWVTDPGTEKSAKKKIRVAPTLGGLSVFGSF
jgi:hypothetical protein